MKLTSLALFPVAISLASVLFPAQAQDYQPVCDNLGAVCSEVKIGQWWHAGQWGQNDGGCFQCGGWTPGHWHDVFGPECFADTFICPVVEPPPSNLGPPECSGGGEGFVGNPINVINGNKFQREIDVQSPLEFGLDFWRAYNSTVSGHDVADNVFPHTMGRQWRHNFQRSIHEFPAGSNRLVAVIRAAGGTSYFIDQDNQVDNEWVSLEGGGRLTSRLDGQGAFVGWRFVEPGASQAELYDASGTLESITQGGIAVATLHYDGQQRLQSVTDRFGGQLLFSYNSALADAKISAVTMPGGQHYTYGYDQNDNLVEVRYPDTTSSNDDNPKRQYLYEDPAHPAALTGIIDERGVRFGSWSYDASGRAIRSERGAPGSGIDLETIDYSHIDDTADPRVTVSNALGKQTTYHLASIQGVARRVDEVEGHASTYCLAANLRYTHNTRGDLASVVDREGNLTELEYDYTGLLALRREAVGTAQERETVYEWDIEHRRLTREIGPELMIEYQYDPQSGELLKTSRVPPPPPGGTIPPH